MASYEKRKKELLEPIPFLETRFPTELTFLNMAVEEYMKSRDEILTELQAIAADVSDNPRASDWRDKLAKGPQALKKIEEALRAVSVPSKPALDFQNSAVNNENIFWKSLGNLDVGAHRDILMLRRKQLQQYHKDLDAKWQATKNENNPLREDSKKAILELVDFFDKAIDKTASMFEKLINSAGALNNGFKKIEVKIKEHQGEGRGNLLIAAIKSLLMTLAGEVEAKDTFERLGEMLRSLSEAKEGVVKRVPAYRSRVIAQSRVLSAVPQAQRVTEEFLQKGGVEVTRKEYEDLCKALESWSSSQPTNGLKDDSHEIAKALAAGLNGHVAAMDKAYIEFQEKHKGRLFGELARDVVLELIDDRLPEDLGRSFMAKALEAKLRAWNDDIRTALAFELEENFRRIEDRLRDQPEDIQKELRDYVAGYKDALTQRMREFIENIDRESKEVADTCRPDKVQGDFENKSLMDILRR